MKRLHALLAALVLAVTAHADAVAYKIDPVHSTVGFSLRHLVAKYTNTFTKVTGTITYDEADAAKSHVEATVEIASLNTANQKRDTHLMSADFFDTANHPVATFKSSSWTKTGADTFDVAGDLTIRGVTKQVVFHVTLLGTGPGMGGATLSGWEATTKINRSDFGVAYGPKVLGEEVTLNLAIEAGHKPAPAAPPAPENKG